MANLVVQHEAGDEFYRVLDVDKNLIVGSFVDPQVANAYAAAGNTSKEALFSAVRSDINATGGEQKSANTSKSLRPQIRGKKSLTPHLPATTIPVPRQDYLSPHQSSTRETAAFV